MSLACSSEGMVVRLATRDPFSGLLFSQAGGKSCQTRGQQRTQTELQILFRDTDVDRCASHCDEITIFGECANKIMLVCKSFMYRCPS